MITKYQIHGTPLLVSDKIKINGNLYDFPNDDFKALYTAIIYKMRDQESALAEAKNGLVSVSVLLSAKESEFIITTLKKIDELLKTNQNT